MSGNRIETSSCWRHNMSAIVCGKRSNFFDDLQASSSSSSPPPVSKRIRCSSSSPVRFSPPTPTTTTAAIGPSFSSFSANFFSPASSSSSVLDQLVVLFPNMDKQVTYLFSFLMTFFFYIYMIIYGHGLLHIHFILFCYRIVERLFVYRFGASVWLY